GLTALCIGVERGWINPSDAMGRVRTMLRFLRYEAPHREGFFFHFMDRSTGDRKWKCEFSSIDTALMLAGALTVREFFDDREISDLAGELFDRVNWPWMLNGGQTLSMGYKPRYG